MGRPVDGVRGSIVCGDNSSFGRNESRNGAKKRHLEGQRVAGVEHCLSLHEERPEKLAAVRAAGPDEWPLERGQRAMQV